MPNIASSFNLLPQAQQLNGVSTLGAGGTPDQSSALGMAALSAAGKMPSAADYAQRAGLQQAQQAAGAQAASTRGSLGLAGAQHAAMATQAGLAQQAVNAGAAQRAAEQQAALSQYGQLAGQQRSQDLQGDANSFQVANANAQLAQGQQGANQGMSTNILSGAVGGAMKLAPALAMMSDARAKTEMSYGDMPVGTSYLQEPGPPHDGHSPASFAFREESAGRGHLGFVALIDHQSGRIGKVPMAPLTPSEARQVMSPHGAGPIGRHNDMGVSGLAPAMKQRYGDLPVGSAAQPPTLPNAPADSSNGGWMGAAQPFFDAGSAFASRLQGRGDEASSGDRRAGAEQVEPGQAVDQSPTDHDDNTHDRAARLASRLGGDKGQQQYEEAFADHFRATGRGLSQDEYHNLYPSGRVEHPFTSSVERLRGSGPTAPFMYRDMPVGDYGPQISQMGPATQAPQPAPPHQTAYSRFTGRPFHHDVPQGDHHTSRASLFRDMPVENTNAPATGAYSNSNADGTWTKDSSPAAGAPAPGSALAKMALSPKPGQEWMAGASPTFDQFDHASAGQIANMSDSQLRSATAPGGYAGGYSPNKGSLTFSGPSEAADAQKPVSWLDKPAPGGISSNDAIHDLGLSQGAGADGSNPAAITDFRMKPRSAGIAGFGGRAGTPASTSDQPASNDPAEWNRTGIYPPHDYLTTHRTSDPDAITSDANAKDEAHYQGYLRGIKEATAPDSIAKVSHLAPYMDAGRPGDSFVMSPHGYVPAEPPQPTQPLLAPYKPASGDQPAQVLSPTGYVRAEPPPPPQEGPVKYADRIYNDEPVGPQPNMATASPPMGSLPPLPHYGKATGDSAAGVTIVPRHVAMGSFSNSDPHVAEPVYRPSPVAKENYQARGGVDVPQPPANEPEDHPDGSYGGDQGFDKATSAGAHMWDGFPQPWMRQSMVGMHGNYGNHDIVVPEGDTITSDARAKRMEASHPGFAAASEFMDHLEPHAFTWRDKSVAPNAKAAESPNIGVFAQQVEASPWGKAIVGQDPRTGFKTMDKGALLGALAASVGATKKLSDDHALRIEQLERALGTRR